MIKAHKIRLHPTPEQAFYFARAAGTARFVYNWSLGEWKRQYEAGDKISALVLKKQFNALRKEQFPWTYDVSKSVIEGAFMDLASAFKNFFAALRWAAVWVTQRSRARNGRDSRSILPTTASLLASTG